MDLTTAIVIGIALAYLAVAHLVGRRFRRLGDDYRAAEPDWSWPRRQHLTRRGR